MKSHSVQGWALSMCATNGKLCVFVSWFYQFLLIIFAPKTSNGVSLFFCVSLLFVHFQGVKRKFGRKWLSPIMSINTDWCRWSSSCYDIFVWEHTFMVCVLILLLNLLHSIEAIEGKVNMNHLLPGILHISFFSFPRI